MSATPTSDTTCYRHPNRPAPLKCTRCGRPICLEDAIDAPVGFLCPEDARQPARVRAIARSQGAQVTMILTGINVVLYVLQQVPGLGNSITTAGVLFGPAVAAGEWWRIVTSGFLHASIIHVGFNAYLLYQLGRMLEPSMGRARFGAVYAAGLFGGSAGAALLSWTAPTLGASGAVFGLMGAAMVGMRRAGVNPWTSNIGFLVILNLVFTFSASGVSIGGHLGGITGGALAALAIYKSGRPMGEVPPALVWTIAGGLGALAIGLGVFGPWFG